MHGVICYRSTIYISACRVSHLHHQKAPGRRQRVTSKNSHDSEPDLLSAGILSEHHLLHIPGEDYEQVKGAAMGSPLSPLVANLFMEDLETKALATAPSTSKIWKRFVDGTFTIIQKAKMPSLITLTQLI